MSISQYVVLGIVAVFALIRPVETIAQPACSSTNDNSCVVYVHCIERNCNCASTNYDYSATFGPKYCGRFGSSAKFSSEGVKWRDKTLSCLKDEIARAYFENTGPPCNCEEIQKKAVDSHSLCYLSAPSVCTLPDEDIREIANIVDKEDIWKLGLDGFREIGVTFMDCYKTIGKDKTIDLFVVYLNQEWDSTSEESC